MPTPSTAAQWKDRAEELELENQELEARLQEIADIAAPERAHADARIERIEKLLTFMVQSAVQFMPAEMQEQAKELLTVQP